MSALFDTVLVANRGEIAVRIMRTLRALGIRSVAVYSDADADARHVRTADIAVRIGPAAARDSYLDVTRVIAAARESGAEAIHPGYGFLSENPALPTACTEAGIVFVGPPASAIEAMGDKIAAKATVAAAGVSVVPGSDGAGLDDAELHAAAIATGFPVLLKPSAGGGGKGMRLVENEGGLAAAIESARREASGSFGDDTLLVERFVRNPRHIEIQVLADQHGNVVHLGERECSLQRRHQKIVEEAPSVLLSAAIRDAMGRQAVEAARACGYRSAGTVEFIVSADRPDEFFFMEMNTRLQVEHPVTEMIYGVDLVEQQLRVAAGEPLAFSQSELTPTGHAVEVRVYAEDADRGFLPTGGSIVGVREPDGPGVRVDSGVTAGSVIGSDYDPMLAKIVAWGDDRDEAMHRLDQALAETALLGVTTNIGFLRRLLADPDVRNGTIDTGLVERRLDDLLGGEVPDAVLAAVALAPLVDAGGSPDPWHHLVAWRLQRPAAVRHELDVAGHGRRIVWTTPSAGDGWSVTIESTDTEPASAEPTATDPIVVRLAIDHDSRWRAVLDGRAFHLTPVASGRTTQVALDGVSWTVTQVEQRGAGDDPAGRHGDGTVRSPMPGTVISVDVAEGDHVIAGQSVAIVEAMKMEHALAAPFDGQVARIHTSAGAAVGLDEAVVTIEADPAT